MIDFPGGRSGNVVPWLTNVEHVTAAVAKRVFLVGLNDAGTDYISPTVHDLATSEALGVILVDGTGAIADPSIAASTTGLYTAIAVTSTPIIVLPIRAERLSAVISNRVSGGASAYVGNDSSISSSNGAIEVEIGEKFVEEGPTVHTGAVYAVVASGTVTLNIWDRWAP